MKPVSEVMRRDAVGIEGTEAVSTALELMKNTGISIAPVVSGGRLIGLLTMERAARGGYSGKTVREVMLRPDAFAEEDTGIEDAAQRMVRSGLSRLPVVNNSREMKVTGIITSTGIMKELKK
ncbi:MAG: CBS domain-containing protein [Candidatus Marsarchaeota archaeon]|nr:CBS domain-containing protein [Candidatus Marsarchaeota archaeon]